ncbi:hypothetical protein EOA85_24055 [Mesorhizobium sp. M5C.F.Ca.IN.020.29.1.1]|uniref:hypothetical protein n=1 Tax=Mesorhizobium sp. M5C.F.Ca.IN.020.29.1.1 TaxID=2496770 RepID=UPI000FCA3473|nr:hypothetical protein [Mesorhizobium sp. M5C.F.Ca.IN.020.29.1.1]RUV54677.1 hypothetical protein EOA85_24055 [Mesorhizobium sp. M5C.F.Ca.IN.020.29.1.1]
MTTIVRIGDLGRWSQVAPGSTIKFDKHKPRKIRLDVRASDEVAWFVERFDPEDGELIAEFLCLTPPGMSVIEMSVDKGGVSLTPQFAAGQYLLFQTPEYEVFNLESPNPGDTFLKIAHRRQRNPEVEYMEFLMNQNMEARLRQMDEEIARRMALLPTERNDGNGETSGTGNGVHQRQAPQREELQKAAGAAKPSGGASGGSIPPAGVGNPQLSQAGNGPAGDAGNGQPDGGTGEQA